MGFKIVGIGASAGGLEACRKLIDALPANTGMAFILIQHLDPHYSSMMVELLANHTRMKVVQAAEGMAIEPNCLYVIPPGTYLKVSGLMLRISKPLASHGSRLPFDFLLNSMAEEFGGHAVCVVLSGTGADGSIGLKSVHEKGGLVIVQDPQEAGYDGMPQNAIATGLVDHILPVSRMLEALVEAPKRGPNHTLDEIVELLRKKTTHNFSLYKHGTLQRRIERRMFLAGIVEGEMEKYLKLLHDQPGEMDTLAKDMLINVTGFFRDPKVFQYLSEKIISDIVKNQGEEKYVRIWIAGCSTGEEAYSFAMLFREKMTAGHKNIKLQIFASDVDGDAVTVARAGRYPETIKEDISPTRLARFFSKEGSYYSVSSELRSSVTFTVQDVLSDPPFSRLDLISCRNLLIYLGAEAQARVISMFHFALRKDGILVLGNAETVSKSEGRFVIVSKPDRIYRHIGRSSAGELNFLTAATDGARVVAKAENTSVLTRQSALAELCRRLVMESFAPAAVLVNSKYECVYTTGPVDRYLSVASGHSTHEVLAMARLSLRSKLKRAIEDATRKNARVVFPGGRIKHNGKLVNFGIDARPVRSDDEDFTLICFVVEPVAGSAQPVAPSRSGVQMADLEIELQATKIELNEAIRSLEVANEDQRAINEEALSVNEEYQSTNEELLTSKEELQSLNEELNALNSQLHETLDRQRSTSDDLQNILYSTNVATLFLDTELNIRFFTPATKSVFNVIPTDVGRPLADLYSISADTALPADAQLVLTTLAPVDREIETQVGIWFTRRILPYRTSDNHIDGVVITFTDISERKRTLKALELATQKAELASKAKSRFLAAASHDLRQPMQTLALLQGSLAKNVEGEKPKKLVVKLDQTLVAMTDMLDTWLDIHQIETGTVNAAKSDFQLGDLLRRLYGEFNDLAQAKNLLFCFVPSQIIIHSNARLLEQMLRNLINNALKYTHTGKILLGCRRHQDSVCIEIWDTGVGIPASDFKSIFEEFYQLGNAARERSRGVGLGLAIVQQLANLLDHKLTVQSKLGKGSVFSIEVNLLSGNHALSTNGTQNSHYFDETVPQRVGTILVIEDDPEVRDLIELALQSEGHKILTAPNGRVALEMAEDPDFRPDIILSDYNLPNGSDGVLVSGLLREKMKKRLPVIILSADISAETMQRISDFDCVKLRKPVQLKEMIQVVQRLLAFPPGNNN